MNERLLEAIKTLKQTQNTLIKEINDLKKEVNENQKFDVEKIFSAVADSLMRFTIVDDTWFYNGKDTGIKARGETGKEGAPGKDGKAGKQGPQGPQGIPGKDGKDGKDGLPGRNGLDAIIPDLKIGKVETSPEYGGALAKFRKGKDGKIYLDLTLPRGPQGFTGFDGKNGKDATINGMNTLEIVAGKNVNIVQEGNKLIISARGGSSEDTYLVTSDNKDFITSDNAEFIVEEDW